MAGKDAMVGLKQRVQCTRVGVCTYPDGMSGEISLAPFGSIAQSVGLGCCFMMWIKKGWLKFFSFQRVVRLSVSETFVYLQFACIVVVKWLQRFCSSGEVRLRYGRSIVESSV